MKARRLGNTGLLVSEIGLGCQSLGGGLYHGRKRNALELVARALDQGFTYFDTADHYSLGLSEEWLGAALRPVRERVVIGTKVGTVYTRAARTFLRIRPLLRSVGSAMRPLKHGLDRIRSTQRRADFSVPYLSAAVDASLRRLRTDYLDLLHLHKPPLPSLQSGAVQAAIEALRQSGKVRFFGVSCEHASDALACLDIRGVSCVQVTVNLLDQEAVAELLAAARAKGVGVIARNPRAAGLLTERFGDITAETYALNRAEYATLRENARRFSFLAREGRTLAQAAIRYVLQLEGISATIPRANDERELDEAVAACALPELTAAELEQVRLTLDRLAGHARKYRYRSTLSATSS